jgi:hypothetical protein
MSNPFKAVAHFFEKLFHFVIKSDPFKQFVAEMLPVAVDAVLKVSTLSGLSSAQRRDQAFHDIAYAAKAKGLEFADHFIYLVIELAVANLKGTIGPVE